MPQTNSFSSSTVISPTSDYLAQLHQKFSTVQEGAVATYIPELAKANPNHFGIALVTATGAVYEVGDTQAPFTIQSISKPFVYGMALVDHGSQHVLTKVGVEPTGDAFNSISLDPGTGRPRNPMINAGAIASAGLLMGQSNIDRLQRIIDVFSRFAGRRLTLDEAVYRSESETGHRNRAIGHLLRNFNIIEQEPTPATELYFMQCSISVTCRDLAVMAATLANRGINPVTGQRAIHEGYVSSMLSVMSSCGMYDYAGEWLYKVGMPAKSGVSGGVIAVLPGQLGIAVYSPRLDAQGNTVRGIRVCEAISRDLELHLFASPSLGKTSIRRKFTGVDLRSTRVHSPQALARLAELRPRLRIYQMQGSLGFAATEVAIRDIVDSSSEMSCLLLDFKRVIAINDSSCRLLEKLFDNLLQKNIPVGIVRANLVPEIHRRVESFLARRGTQMLRNFEDIDMALEWAEGRMLETSVPESIKAPGPVKRADYELLKGLTAEELAELEKCFERRSFAKGAVIMQVGSEARELCFLATGSVSVMVPLPAGASKRVATFCPGMAFGEMALLDGAPRSATVVADGECDCDVLKLAQFDSLTETHPRIKIVVLTNLCLGVSARLREANRQLSLFD